MREFTIRSAQGTSRSARANGAAGSECSSGKSPASPVPDRDAGVAAVGRAPAADRSPEGPPASAAESVHEPPEALPVQRERLRARLRDFERAVEAASDGVRAAADDLETRLAALEADLTALLPPEEGEPGGDRLARSRETSSWIRGPLSEVSVIEVVEFVRLTKKTGVLHVSSEKTAAEIHFENGQAVRASMGAGGGFEAFRDAIALQSGFLEFVTTDMPVSERNLDRSTLELVMRALRHLDERDTRLRR